MTLVRIMRTAFLVSTKPYITGSFLSHCHDEARRPSDHNLGGRVPDSQLWDPIFLWMIQCASFFYYIILLKSLRSPMRDMYLGYSTCILQRRKWSLMETRGQPEGQSQELMMLKGKHHWSINYKYIFTSFSLDI